MAELKKINMWKKFILFIGRFKTSTYSAGIEFSANKENNFGSNNSKKRRKK